MRVERSSKRLNPVPNTYTQDFVALPDVLRVSQLLSETLPLAERLRQLTQLMLHKSGGDWCVLVMPNAAADSTETTLDHWQAVVIATPESAICCQEPIEDSPNVPLRLIQHVKETQKPVSIDDLVTELPVVDEALKLQQPKSLFCLPMVSQHQLVGIWYFCDRSASGTFSTERKSALMLVSHQATLSLENARLQQQLQLSTQLLEGVRLRSQSDRFHIESSEAFLKKHSVALFNLMQSQAISKGKLQTAFQEITAVTARLINAARVSIWLIDKDHTKIRCVDLFTQHDQQHVSGTELCAVDYPSYFSEIMMEPLLCVNEAQRDPRTSEFLEGYLDVFDITAMLDANVYVNGEMKGVICCEHVGTSRSWYLFEQNFARSMANLVSLALVANQREDKAQKLKQTLSQLGESQLQTVQSAKMASLGNLVAGVAHEINNPLGFLNGSLQNAQNYLSDLLEHIALYEEQYPEPAAVIADNKEEIDLAFVTEDFEKLIQAMKGATDRIKAISTSLRTFSRADAEHKVAANVNEGLDSTLLILKYRLKDSELRPEIQVVKAYGSLPQLDCFPGQLNQVFMNILANAIDAIDEASQGKDFAELKQQPKRITVSTRVEHETMIVAIADNGPGMSSEVKDRIFDRLYTTKAAGKGTGIGLAITHQIITEKHGGRLLVTSEVGQGTTFEIHLPLQVS